MAQKAKKEGEKIEKPSIAVKEKKSLGERRELTDDQRMKKGKIESGLATSATQYTLSYSGVGGGGGGRLYGFAKCYRNKTGSSGQLFCMVMFQLSPGKEGLQLASYSMWLGFGSLMW